MNKVRLLTMLLASSLAVNFGVLLAACESSVKAPRVDLHDGPAEVQGSQRFTVTRVAAFEDSLAYYGERGIYTIKDRATGKEYLGVSGIGITEIGTHNVGDTTVRDER